MNWFEPFAQPRTPLKQFLSDLSPSTGANAVIGFVFAATGPVAVVLAVGSAGGLDEATLASWIFGSFFVNGFLTLIACWLYRQPMVFFWTIPGTVLVGPALEHLSFAQVIGAFYATGLLMVALGALGWVRKAMQAIPMPIVMGMVAGVFLRFGLDWVLAVRDDWALAGVMTAVFVLLSSVPALGKRVPPLIGALLTGTALVLLTGRLNIGEAPATGWMSSPVFIAPEFSLQAMLELVIPLAITVLVVQNGQGIAVLKQAGHDKPPVNAITIACGMWSMLVATVGTVSTCLTGPTNALISSSGPKHTHYAAGVLVGLLAIAFGLFTPAFTRFMLACPPAFIATLAGLAMLKVLQGAFSTAFGGQFQLGALISFLITVSGVSVLNIGAPFWGLVFGALLSWLMERNDYRQHA
ncbi:MAG: benzoate/H(+) symporter BenE family transporter [Burkholderiaceae bacterium]